MKELSIEEKAKAYDEAIELVNSKWHYKNQPCFIDVTEIFPELKDGEDERIRKDIISHFAKGIEGSSFDEVREKYKIWIAWLEKQGEKPNNVYDKELSEILGRVIRRYINDPDIPYSDREKVSMKVLPYVELLEKQGERMSDPRYSILDKLIEADGIYQMAMNDAMVQEAKTKAIDALSKLEIGKLLEIEKQGEQKPADKAEPKFHEGDWIINSQGTLRHIINVDKGGYQTDGGWLTHDTYEKTFHLWTIQDAKAGDVLYCKSSGIEYIVILKDISKNGNINSYCRYNTCSGFGVDIPNVMSISNNPKPATKEQRDLLFQKMKGAGYEWDAEKKELKKVEQKPIDVRTTGYWHVEDVEQKPAWSEEDELHIRELEGLVKRVWAIAEHENDKDTIHEMSDLSFFLKTLKPQPKQEWSEEDEKMLKDTIRFCELCGNKVSANWLKSLKQKYTWKPSDEQIEILDMVLTNESMDDNIARILRELREQLKKLKG